MENHKCMGILLFHVLYKNFSFLGQCFTICSFCFSKNIEQIVKQKGERKMGKIKDLTGQTFGELTVIKDSG